MAEVAYFYVVLVYTFETLLFFWIISSTCLTPGYFITLFTLVLLRHLEGVIDV
jgi:hypothetical protein